MRKNNYASYKSFVAITVCIAMILTLSACINRLEKEQEFQAYYEPIDAQDVKCKDGMYYVESQILLTASKGVADADIKELIDSRDGEILGYISTTGDYQVRFPVETYDDLVQLIDELRCEKIIEDAAMTYVGEMKTDTVDYKGDRWDDSENPEDKSGSVWNENNPEGNNWWAEAIKMPSVWNRDLELHSVKVGIIDSIFDVDNMDLKDKFVRTWNNPQNEDGSCRVASYCSELFEMYEQAKKDGDEKKIEQIEIAVNTAEHGTHVAGIIAAQAGNGFGITGVSKNAKLYGYAFLSEEADNLAEAQWGSIFLFKCAIAQLLNEGVKVINISMGFNKALEGAQAEEGYWKQFVNVNSMSLERFLKKYIELGKEFLIIKTAGNSSTSSKKYDAAFDVFGAISNKQVSSRIIIVGAAKCSPNFHYYSSAEFSNMGSRVNVYAPGVNVLSDIPQNRTKTKDGTSMAAPIVTGLVSLIWGINPNLSAEQVRNIIFASVRSTISDIAKNWLFDVENPVSIVNANMCVELAVRTEGNGATSAREFGTLMGVVCAVNSAETEFELIAIESLNVYDEHGEFVEGIPLQPITDFTSDENGEPETTEYYLTYSALLAPGTYNIEANPREYESQIKQIVISENDASILDFVFSPQLEQSPEISENSVPNKRLTHIYTYDAMNRVQTEEKFHYDRNGQLSLIDRIDVETSNSEKVIFNYNENGQMTLRAYGAEIESKWTSYAEIEYVYNTDGVMISKEGWEGPTWWKYEYDSTGKLIRTENCSDDMKTVAEYTYDEQGRKASKLTKIYFFGESTETYGTYAYDAQGRLASITTSGRGFLDEMTEVRSVYTYDTFDRLTCISTTGTDVYGETTDKQKLYTYDLYGREMYVQTIAANSDSVQTNYYDFYPLLDVIIKNFYGQYSYTTVSIDMENEKGNGLYSNYFINAEVTVASDGLSIQILETEWDGTIIKTVLYYEEVTK